MVSCVVAHSHCATGALCGTSAPTMAARGKGPRIVKALRAVEETFADILNKGHQRDRLPFMMTRAELYDLLGYENYEARDKSYFG